MPTLYTMGYDPPYESPLEDALAWKLVKYLRHDSALDKQEEVETPFGTFRLDLSTKTPSGRLIAFECDGQEYHADTFRDRCRDALILAMRRDAVIYRLRGPDLWYRMDDCVYIIAQKDPSIFWECGLRHIELLASDEARSVLEPDWVEMDPEGERRRCGFESGNTVTVTYREEDRHREFSLAVERRTFSKWFPDRSVLAFLEFALKQQANTPFNHVYTRYLNSLKNR